MRDKTRSHIADPSMMEPGEGTGEGKAGVSMAAEVLRVRRGSDSAWAWDLSAWAWVGWKGGSLICIYLFILFYSYVHTMFGSFLPPAPTPSLTTHPPSTPSIPSRNYFALISNFVVERV
jgi:hypothetical protein